MLQLHKSTSSLCSDINGQIVTATGLAMSQIRLFPMVVLTHGAILLRTALDAKILMETVGLMLHQIGLLILLEMQMHSLMTLPNGETVTVMDSVTILLGTILTNVLVNTAPLP